jgi:hypothetical protein
MARGFIQEPLELKLLILYILDRLSEPVDLSTLTDLVLCDEGVDYFQFSQALTELQNTEHVLMKDHLYRITDKGHTNSVVCENELPYSVRAKCDQNVARTNARLCRNRQVQASVTPREDGSLTVHLSLHDEAGSVLDMDVLALSKKNAVTLKNNFQAHAEQIYNAVLTALLADYDKKE